MKKILGFLVLVTCLILLCPAVFAESSIQMADISCDVSQNGACSVNMSVSLRLENPEADPVLPLPGDASDITLNGSRGSVSSSGRVKNLSLRSVTGGGPGEFTFHVHYTLSRAVDAGDEGMELTLPLLSGFAFPVEQLRFTVTLPTEVTTQPEFFSSYYQNLIGEQLEMKILGRKVVGTTGDLKDHETLTMKLPVTDAMFPQPAAEARVMGVLDMVILAAVVLALMYYILTMRPSLFRRISRATAPDGVSAGDLQLWLTGSGVDFSLLVVTWAQLGYLRIQVDDNNRVLLHKRMEMGNERSRFENRCFRSLFGTRRLVDGTGYHYARLCRSMWSQTPNIREVFRPYSGNPKLFLGLCTVVGLISGVKLAGSLLPNSLFLKILLSLVTGGFSLVLQAGGASVPRRNKLWLYLSAACAGVWLLLAGLGDILLHGWLMVAFQFLAGIARTYGGRRTLLGQQTMEQIFALRRHMRRARKADLQQLQEANENYFFNLAPYALALGVDRSFAARFGNESLQECNYLIVGSRRQRNAAEWAQVLRGTVQILDAKAKLLPFERFGGR